MPAIKLPKRISNNQRPFPLGMHVLRKELWLEIRNLERAPGLAVKKAAELERVIQGCRKLHKAGNLTENELKMYSARAQLLLSMLVDESLPAMHAQKNSHILGEEYGKEWTSMYRHALENWWAKMPPVLRKRIARDIDGK